MIENSIHPIWNEVVENCICLIWEPTKNFIFLIWLGMIENSICPIRNKVIENYIHPIWKPIKNSIRPIMNEVT